MNDYIRKPVKIEELQMGLVKASKLAEGWACAGQ
jgi:hypothetical protein